MKASNLFKTIGLGLVLAGVVETVISGFVKNMPFPFITVFLIPTLTFGIIFISSLWLLWKRVRERNGADSLIAIFGVLIFGVPFFGSLIANIYRSILDIPIPKVLSEPAPLSITLVILVLVAISAILTPNQS